MFSNITLAHYAYTMIFKLFVVNSEIESDIGPITEKENETPIYTGLHFYRSWMPHLSFNN